MICQVLLLFLVMMIRTRAEKRRLLIVHKHTLYVCPPVKRDQFLVKAHIYNIKAGGLISPFVIDVEHFFNINQAISKTIMKSR